MTPYRLLMLPAALAALMTPGASVTAAPAPQPLALKPAALVTPKASARPAASVPVTGDSSKIATALPALAVPVAEAPATVSDEYTGIVIDARALPEILRSPAPAIYGPLPEASLLYPNRSDVPTPDEVQDESVVRYYHSENEAEAGVAGSHPLILKAVAVLGPAKDALQLSAADMAALQDLDKKLHFSHTWKVGFLIPADH